MSLGLGIFSDDKFSLETLTAAINEIPRLHTPLGDSGLFEEEPISTLSVAIEREGHSLSLIQTGTRGISGVPRQGGTRSLKSFATTHLKITGQITADDIQNIRPFGSTSKLEAVQSVINKRFIHDVKRFEHTLEYQRAGALQGKLLDADGSTVLIDFYSEFGIARSTAEIDLAAGKLDGSVVAAKDKSDDEASDAVVTGYNAFCGQTFFDALKNSPALLDWRKYANAQGLLADDGDSFDYNGVRWIRYRAKSNTVSHIPATEAVLVPRTSVPIFQTVFAPADYVETANTMGLPRYAKQALTDNMGRSITLETQSQTLSYCTRLGSLIKLTIKA